MKDIPERPTPEAMLQHEATMLNRPVEYVDFHETLVTWDGNERLVSTLIYRVLPHEVAGVMLDSARMTVWVDGRYSVGAVL